MARKMPAQRSLPARSEAATTASENQTAPAPSSAAWDPMSRNVLRLTSAARTFSSTRNVSTPATSGRPATPVG